MPADPGKYARPELERRFLLAAAPDGLVLKARIADLYLDGTRLRLRRVAGADGTVIHKLGQKVRPDGADPSENWITTIYLDAAEYEVFAALPGRRLTKDRHDWPGTGCTVDVFAGDLTGLVTAELELADRAAFDDFEPPPGVAAEVTHDDRFSGGRLVSTAADELAALLSEVGG
jgi:CYTH domain-containing protein